MIWDNLAAHKANIIYFTVYRAGHRIVCRPPYRPKFGPTEYFFAQLCNGVRRCADRIRTVEDLIADVMLSLVQ